MRADPVAPQPRDLCTALPASLGDNATKLRAGIPSPRGPGLCRASQPSSLLTWADPQMAPGSHALFLQCGMTYPIPIGLVNVYLLFRRVGQMPPSMLPLPRAPATWDPPPSVSLPPDPCTSFQMFISLRDSSLFLREKNICKINV